MWILERATRATENIIRRGKSGKSLSNDNHEAVFSLFLIREDDERECQTCQRLFHRIIEAKEMKSYASTTRWWESTRARALSEQNVVDSFAWASAYHFSLRETCLSIFPRQPKRGHSTAPPASPRNLPTSYRAVTRDWLRSASIDSPTLKPHPPSCTRLSEY